MFGTVGGWLGTSDAAELVLDLVAPAIVPMLFISFYPPPWLRRLWSQPEEEELRQGLHSLLTFSPYRVTQAGRALDWATRLVGGKRALIIDSHSSLLTYTGFSVEQSKP